MSSIKKRRLDKLTKEAYKEYQKNKIIKKKSEDHFEQENFEKEAQIEDDLKEDLDKHDLQYEEDFDDEFEDEDIVMDDNEGQIEVEDDKNEGKNGKSKKEKVKQKPFLGSNKQLQPGEVLEVDNRAYEMLHRANTEWPCLSCDFLLPLDMPYSVKNTNFQKMDNYPYKIFFIAGTQSADSQNYLYLMKWSKLYKTKYDDDSDYQDSDSEEESQKDAELDIQQIKVNGAVNRVKSLNHLPIVAYWTDNAEVNILDFKQRFQILGGDPMTNPSSIKQPKSNLKTFKNTEEGFALEWNQLNMGQLASGSCDAKIYIYNPANNGMSDIIRDDQFYNYHKQSVEDIAWSPENQFHLASCSVDKTIQIIDLRTGKRNKSELLIRAHDSDVNVISWSKMNANLIASGSDDGSFKIWDKRFPQSPYTEIYYHQEPITSISFQPNDEGVISVSSADNRLTIWDLAVENDQSQNKQEGDESIPDQLMFMHQGQDELKELRYHPIYYELIISTSADGIHLFKPAIDVNESSIISDEEDEDSDEILEINEKDIDQYFGKMKISDD